MNVNLYLFQAAIHVCYFLSLFFSIRAKYKKVFPSYMNGFYWYPLIGAILVIFHWLQVLEMFPADIYKMLIRFSLVYHFVFISVFICKVLKSRQMLTKEITAILIFLPVTIFLVAIDMYYNLLISFLIVNLIVMGFCLDFYFKIMNSPGPLKLVNDPSFWIVSGVFLCTGMMIPVHVFNRFLLTNFQQYYYPVMLIGGIGFGIMHLFFVKALTCKSVLIHNQ